MTIRRDVPVGGPIVQSLTIGFRALVLVTLLLALVWSASNVRQVPPSEQAVITRFGAVVGVVRAGLAMALPRPLEAVILVPADERQIELKVQGGGADGPALVDPAAAAAGQAPPPSAAPFLTGDGGVVVLDTTLTWHITNAAAWYLAQDHVRAALRRLYLATATTIAAGGGLDDFLVARAGGPGAQRAREALRGALVDGINARLAALRSSGADLGVECTRADVEALLPPSAKIAFDQVLEATQMAEQSLAAARTDAMRAIQAAERQRDQFLTEARAAAAERINEARAQVAGVNALAGQMRGGKRADALDLLWRQRIAAILRQTGSVIAVDPTRTERLILPSGPASLPGAKQ